jgi:hypothetical protein
MPAELSPNPSRSPARPAPRFDRAAAAFVLACLVPIAGFAVLATTWHPRPPRATAKSAADDGPNVTRVTGTRPGDGEGGVLPNAFIAADVNLPHTGHGIDSATLSPATVRLYRTSDRAPVAARVNTSGAGDSIVLTPLAMLEPETSYTFQVTSGLRDTSGDAFQPFRSTFTTAKGAPASDYPVAFEKVELDVAKEIFTGLTFGPDGRLYSATFDGKVLRFDVRADGTLAPPERITTVQANNAGPRLITGIKFDPASTVDAPVLWVSHGVMALENAPEWTGKISRLSGPALDRYEDVIVALPRGYRDHLNNQLDFGPDGAIYFNQGSMTATGAPDKKWNLRVERRLSAAILRLDPARLAGRTLPVDVKTPDGGGSYDPTAPDAPLTLYATGVRVGFDLLWHSSGHLYVPTNGSAKGGNAPASPDGSVSALNDVATQPDLLLRVARGGYYGHPNPSRGEYVLNGGNPTNGHNPLEVAEYPVGTRPDPKWRGPAYDFGKSASPNGVIEYTNAIAFNGALKGKLLITRYSGGDDVLILTPGDDGTIVEVVSGAAGLTQFTDPLDLVEDPRTGNVYVAEFGGQKLSLLRPAASGNTSLVSRRVFRQQVTAADLSR